MDTLNQALAPFIPMAWRQAIALGQDLSTATTGTALFADISGFTPLTTALLEQLGSDRGPEELTTYLNQIYTTLISHVHNHRGSVIGFSGDAILCWFATSETITFDHTILLATTSAWHMQAAMQQLNHPMNLPPSAPPLAIKIAVTAGSAHRFLVGSPQTQRLPLVAGHVIDRTAHAEKSLQADEIAIGAEILSQFGPHLTIKAWRLSASGEYFAIIDQIDHLAEPQPWPSLANQALTDIKGWVLPPVAERLRHGPFMAQLRSCTPLFLKFTGLNFDQDPQAPQKLDAYIRWVQAILNRYEGHLIQLTLGDKGSYLYASFGPLVAHEDNATRAVATAVALQTPPANLSFITTTQIGISQGQMYTGTYGSPDQYTFGVLGNEVNIAARLMNKAEAGQTLVTSQISKAVTTFTFGELPPLTLKGVAKPLPVSVITTRTSTTPPLASSMPTATPIIGRNSELNRLLDTLDDLQKGLTQVVIIEGEAGIGKSHLLNNWREKAVGRACLPIWGAANALETDTPYYVWRQIFPQLFATALDLANPTAQQAAIREQLTAVWGPDDPLLNHLPLLNTVLPIIWPDNDTTTPLTGEGRAHQTRTLFTKILATEAQQRALFIIIEDAHWLDASSWELIRLLMVDVHPLLLAIVTRPIPEPWPSAYNYLQRHPDRIEINLSKLTADEIEEMICLQFGIKKLPESIAKLVHERAEGHPFFSEQLVHGLLDSGIITIHHGECNLVPGINWHTITLPQTVHEVIVSRIDRLSVAEQLTLKVASVIGRAFEPQILRELHPIEKDKPHLDNHLHQLTQKELILIETTEETNYIFKHAITQEVAYNSLLFAQRQALHRSIASWYEAVYSDLQPHYPLIAHHWQQAEDLNKAISYWEKAGHHAINTGAYHEAIHFWGQIITNLPNLTTKPPAYNQANWYFNLGLAHHNVGQFALAFDHLNTALEILDNPISTTTSSQLTFVLPTTSILLRSLRLKIKSLNRIHTPSPTDNLLIQIYFYLLLLGFITNTGLGYNAQLVNRINNLATKINAWAPLAYSYSSLAIGLNSLGQERLAQHFITLAHNLADQLPNNIDSARVNMTRAIYHLERAQFSQAQNLLASVAETAQNNSHIHLWIEAMSLVSPILNIQGDYLSAQSVAAQVHQYGLRYNDHFVQGLQRKHEAMVAWRQGNPEEAFALAQESVAIMKQDQSSLGQLTSLAALLLIQVGTNRLSMAAHTAPQVTALLRDNDIYTFQLYEAPIALTEYAFASWTDESSDSQRAEAEQACTQLRHLARHSWANRPWAAISLGRFAWRTNRQAQALSWFQRAIDDAEELNMPYELGWAHYHLGRRLVGTDPVGRTHLKKASEIFERLGATQAQQQVDNIL
ncbi:MAG TPA: AAA family ATPase [Anaerolineae bacterium]|nr:AAA family ATPase [Anaerolineae bacterium]